MENQTTWTYYREKKSLYLKYGILTVLHPWSLSQNALKEKYCHCPICLWKSNQIWKYSFVCSFGSTEVFDGKTFSNQILVFFLNQFLAVFDAALTLFLLSLFFFFPWPDFSETICSWSHSMSGVIFSLTSVMENMLFIKSWKTKPIQDRASREVLEKRILVST